MSLQSSHEGSELEQRSCGLGVRCRVKAEGVLTPVPPLLCPQDAESWEVPVQGAEPDTESSERVWPCRQCCIALTASVIFLSCLQWIYAVNVLQQHKIPPAPQHGKPLPAAGILQPRKVNHAEQRDMQSPQALGPHQAHRGPPGKRERNWEFGDGRGWAPVLSDCIQPPGARWGNKHCGTPSHSDGVFCHGKLLWVRNGKSGPHYSLITPHGIVSPEMTTLCYLTWFQRGVTHPRPKMLPTIWANAPLLKLPQVPNALRSSQ